VIEDETIATIKGVPASAQAKFSPITQPIRQPKPDKAA
jgi:hypothetical protein